MVRVITSESEFDNLIKSETRLIVVDFTATWWVNLDKDSLILSSQGFFLFFRYLDE